MGFKLPGKSIQSGTAGHSSALKMRSEQIASAFKQVNLKTGNVGIPALEAKKKEEGKPHLSKKGNEMAGDKAWSAADKKSVKSTGDSLDNLIKTRSGQKKGSDEYNTTQNKINSAMGSKKVHATKAASQSKETQAKKAIVDTKAKVKSKKIITKAEDNAKVNDKGDFKVDYKAERKLVRTEQRASRRKARLDVKEARQTSGRGSDEVKAAKEAKKANNKANRAQRKQQRVDQKENKAVQKGKLPDYLSPAKMKGPDKLKKKKVIEPNPKKVTTDKEKSKKQHRPGTPSNSRELMKENLKNL